MPISSLRFSVICIATLMLPALVGCYEKTSAVNAPKNSVKTVPESKTAAERKKLASEKADELLAELEKEKVNNRATAEASQPEAVASALSEATAKVPLIPRKLLFGNPDKSAARMSHDGKYLSYLAPVNGVMNVWVGPINNPDAAKPVTKDTKRGIRSYFWAYTNKHILYIQDADGDEDWNIYRTNLENNETTNLTELKKVRAEIQEVSHRFPREILIGLNDRDPQYHDIYRLALETGERELVQKNDQFAGFTTDEDYKIRFASKLTEDGGTQMLKPDGSGGWTDFLKISMEDSMTTSPAGFDKSGDVMYLIDSRGRDTGALFKWNLKTDEKELIAEDDKCDVGGIMAHPTENNIQGVSFTYERTNWEFFDDDVAEDFKLLKSKEDGDITVASRTLDDQQWIVAFLKDNGPVKYYHYDRPSKNLRFLFSNRKELEGQPLQKMHSLVIKSRDGMNLVSYLTLPPGTDSDGDGRPDKPVPMMLNVHGGPWGRDGWGFDSEHQLYANRGYAVLSVNFRGSTGFGKEFVNAGNREWAGKMHDDLIDATDWAIKEKITEEDKICIMGGSYGGYATLVGLTFTPEKFACGVDIVGPSNIVTLLNTIPPYWAPAIEMFKSRVGDHKSDEGKKFLEERSPLSHVAKITRPLLIAQGANDPRVKQSESDQIVKAMQEKKIPVTYVLFPDEGHGFARPENNLAFTAVTEAFVARFLGGRYEPIGEAFEGSTVTVPTGANAVPGLDEALKDRKPAEDTAKKEKADAKPAAAAVE